MVESSDLAVQNLKLKKLEKEIDSFKNSIDPKIYANQKFLKTVASLPNF